MENIFKIHPEHILSQVKKYPLFRKRMKKTNCVSRHIGVRICKMARTQLTYTTLSQLLVSLFVVEETDEISSLKLQLLILVALEEHTELYVEPVRIFSFNNFNFPKSICTTSFNDILSTQFLHTK